MSEAPAPQPTPPLDDTVEMGRAINAANALFDRLQTGEHQVATLQHEIDHDSKTGLLSEKKFHDELDAAIETCEPDATITVWVIDLNGFKGINDALGHNEGDQLLEIAGGAISRGFRRESDVIAHGQREHDPDQGIARLGGDEYAIFSKDTPKEGAELPNRVLSPETSANIQADRINGYLQEAIVGTKFEGHPISISIGAAAVNKDIPIADKPGIEAFARADAAMYEMKYRGKIDQITPGDKERLQEIIPFLESKGARIETWLKDAAYAQKS